MIQEDSLQCDDIGMLKDVEIGSKEISNKEQIIFRTPKVASGGAKCNFRVAWERLSDL